MEQINIRGSQDPDKGSVWLDLEHYLESYENSSCCQNLQNIPYLQNISEKISQVIEVNEERVLTTQNREYGFLVVCSTKVLDLVILL